MTVRILFLLCFVAFSYRVLNKIGEPLLEKPLTAFDAWAIIFVVGSLVFSGVCAVAEYIAEAAAADVEAELNKDKQQ